MTSLVCLWMKRRLAAYLDGALSGRRAAAVAAHLEGCSGCREEALRLKKLSELLRSTLGAPPDPDWSGFWDGVRRRILTESPKPRREAWGGDILREIGGHRRLALGGALAGLLLLAAALWPRGPQETLVLEPTVVLNALETAQPEGNLVVFTNPEDEMTVIWVFGLEPPADQSLIRPVRFAPTAS